MKERCQAQRAGGVGARGAAAAPSAKEMEFFHSMGIAGMLPYIVYSFILASGPLHTTWHPAGFQTLPLVV